MAGPYLVLHAPVSLISGATMPMAIWDILLDRELIYLLLFSPYLTMLSQPVPSLSVLTSPIYKNQEPKVHPRLLSLLLPLTSQWSINSTSSTSISTPYSCYLFQNSTQFLSGTMAAASRLAPIPNLSERHICSHAVSCLRLSLFIYRIKPKVLWE